MDKFRAAKPDPRILILQIILSVAVVSAVHTYYALIALFGVLELIILVYCGWKTFLKKMVCFAVLIGALSALTSFYIPVLSVLFPPFFMMLVRVYPTWLTLNIFTARVQMDEMLYVLDRMYIPKTFSIPLMVVYRYVPTILQELHCINESLIMRERNDIRHPLRMVNDHIVPLLSRSEKISEELSAASLCKGLSTKRVRTSCTDVHITMGDVVYLLGMFVVSAGLIVFDLYMRGGVSR